MVARSPMTKWVGLAGIVAATLLSAPAASASCIGQTFSQINYTGPGRYHYVDFPPTATRTWTSIIGRFWSPGQYGSTGEQGCDESRWLIPYPSPRYYINGTFGAMGCTSGCPDGEMIVLLQDKSTNGAEAYFAVGRIDETASQVPAFDFSRIGRDWLLRTIPPPTVTGAGGGDPFPVGISFRDPADAFFALPSVPATSTITAFHVYRRVGHSDPRERTSGAWEFVERVPYEGGITSAIIELRCPWDVSVVHLAAALEFDNGQVLTDYVSSRTFTECDPFTPGAGGTPETGSGALRISKGPLGDLELSWGKSCIPAEQDYEVYEGILGDWTSHIPKTCDTGRQQSISFPPPTFDAYYLVVPFEGPYEGSYGSDGDGNERPLGSSVCRPRILNLCP